MIEPLTYRDDTPFLIMAKINEIIDYLNKQESAHQKKVVELLSCFPRETELKSALETKRDELEEFLKGDTW